MSKILYLLLVFSFQSIFAESVKPDVLRVESFGDYRIVISERGWDSVYNDILIQQMGLNPEKQSRFIVKSLKFKDLTGQPIVINKVSYKYDKKKENWLLGLKVKYPNESLYLYQYSVKEGKLLLLKKSVLDKGHLFDGEK